MTLRATIIVPCYNEAERLDQAAFLAYAERAPGVRFLFVDDGSSDDTRRVIEALAAAHPRCAALSLSPNGGKAEAVRRGFLAALEGDQDAVGFWDADLATPLEDIGRFVALLAARPEVEIVMGARVKLLGRAIQRKPARHYLGRATASIVSTMLRLPVYDTQCGAKLFRVTPRLPGLFAEPFSTRWAFDVEILARWIGAAGVDRETLERHIVEFPLQEWTDVDGSKIRPRDFATLPADLLKILLRYREELAG